MKWTARKFPQRTPRLMLNLEDYDVLRKQVLERDGWRCQSCGSLKDLQVHHVRKRSQLGDDVLENLITLCVGCHAARHRPS